MCRPQACAGRPTPNSRCTGGRQANGPRAMRAAVRAGDEMAALLAVYEAHEHYQRAIAAYDHCTASERAEVDRVDLFVKVANIAYLVGETGRALELVTMALEDADLSAPPARIADALAMFGRQAGIADETDVAFATFERATAILPEEPTPELARDHRVPRRFVDGSGAPGGRGGDGPGGDRRRARHGRACRGKPRGLHCRRLARRAGRTGGRHRVVADALVTSPRNSASQT